ncbi:MAG TPA: DinB family protein [Thermoanaerobaculia bacterium]|nr:DinB family protein [Thermoanaerobaculia bacterium]
MTTHALRRALELHDASAEALLAAATSVADGRWHDALAEGKWTPAQIVAHLIATYDILLQELRGGEGMKIRTRFFQRILLRLLLRPGLLAGRGFPKRAPAPRETRPAERGPDRDEALSMFRERCGELQTLAIAAPPSQRLTHAYFGTAPVDQGLTLCARHIDHHRAQLETLRSE